MIAWLSVVLAVNGSHPAYAAPAVLWGELKPVDSVTVAPTRDHTAFDDSTQPYAAAGLTVSLDISGQTLFEATNSGLGLWDLAANPKNPPRVGAVGIGAIAKAPVGTAANLFVRDVAAPVAGSNLAVLALDNGAGVLMIDVSNKTMPRVVYQDGDPANGGKSCVDATTATLGGKPYALVACTGPRAGVAIYDLTAAAAISGMYDEVAPNAASTYPNVFVADGKLVTSWVDGSNSRDKVITRLDAVDNFVVTNAAVGGGFDLWDLSTPASPKRLGGGGGLDAYGPIALWKAGTRYFVGGATQLQQLQLFEVTAVLNGTAASAGPVLAWAPTVHPFDGASRMFWSRAADGSVFLSYATGVEPAHDATSVGLPGEETLYDVTNPKAPREITPPPGMVSGAATTYWGFSYQFGWVRAGGGRFAGSFFYRAATGLLDIHQWAPPANRPPMVTSTPITTATVKRAYDYAIVASDPEGKPLMFTLLTAPASMSFVGAGELGWVPSAADLGPNPVSVEISDGKNAILHNWTITVSEEGADAGASDGGSGGADGGMMPGPTPKGCGCQAGSGPLLFALLLLVLRRAPRSRYLRSRSSVWVAPWRLTRRSASRPSG